jgi:CheY-like chemotaxis protein
MSTAAELGRPIEILLVEDSPSDAKLTREALKEGKVENRIHHVVDGVEAMSFLRRQGGYGDAPRPDLILLDLNMPRKDGREVLADIRADPDLKHLVVVVLTTSSEERDVLGSYGLNSNMYIVKPVDLDQFFDVIGGIDRFCFTVVTLPPNRPFDK